MQGIFERLDIPTFHGEDPTRWLYKVNHILLLQHFTTTKIELVSFYIEGRAYQDLEESGILTNWDTFVRALLVKFGPNAYDDIMEILTRLKEMGSVEEYKSSFEISSNRLRGLSDTNKVVFLVVSRMSLQENKLGNN